MSNRTSKTISTYHSARRDANKIAAQREKNFGEDARKLGLVCTITKRASPKRNQKLKDYFRAAALVASGGFTRAQKASPRYVARVPPIRRLQISHASLQCGETWTVFPS